MGGNGAASAAGGLGNWLYVIVVIAVFAVMTVVGFALMGVDKNRAKKQQWRIPEATLFIVAACLGGVGGTLGMYVFRHKNQHWYFKVFFPLLAVIETAAVAVGCYFLATM